MSQKKFAEDAIKEAERSEVKETAKTKISADNMSRGDEIIPMDRVRKLIADHMVLSKRTSPHVTSFIDADVTRLC